MIDNNLIIVDVSYYQGKDVPWAALKKAGVDGAICRCAVTYRQSHNTEQDSTWDTNAKACIAAGIPLGAYVYGIATTDAQRKTELACVLKAIKPYKLTLPVFYDVEEQNQAKYMDASAKYFCEGVEAAGYKAGIYIGTWWDDHGYCKDVIAKYPRWIAKYGKNDGTVTATGKNLIKGYKYEIWQYTSKGKFSGSNKEYDVSICYDDDLFSCKPITNETKKSNLTTGGDNLASYSRSKIVDAMNTWLAMGSKAHADVRKVYNSRPANMPYTRNYDLSATDDWCAATVSAAFIKCGYTALFPCEVSCPRIVTNAKKMGIWTARDSYTAKLAGDVVLYDWDKNNVANHIGVITAVSGDTLTVTEGNKGGTMGTRTINYHDSKILGYVCPKYNDNGTSQTFTVKDNKGATVKVSTASLPTLKKGSKGDAVKVLQYLIGTEIDGIFGSNTQTAVKVAQTKAGITADGIVGKDTWAALLC